MDAPHLYPWAVRILWVVLPLTAGPAYGAALHPYSEPVRVTAVVLLWAGWAVVLVGTLVPHPIGLTALRVTAPAAVITAAAAAITNRPSALASAAAVASTLLAFAVAMAPATGLMYVNGSAYPNERRYLLRAPGPLLIGPLELAWAITVGAPAAAALLLAARAWLAGAIVVVAGVPVAVILARSLHRLAQRWLVFVPAGLVLHDPLTLIDPVLFIRKSIASVRPAQGHPGNPPGDALDLGQRAPGLALELLLLEPVVLMLVRPGKPGGESTNAAMLRVVPSRPGQVLREAERRRVPVG
jgi:hypothetical protein